MGNVCCFSQKPKVEPSLPKEDTGRVVLTPYERTIILDTWRHINSDHTNRGVRIFQRILVRPEIKALFPFANMPEEAMMHDPRFRAHGCRFVQSVAAVIEELKTANPQPPPPCCSQTSSSPTTATERSLSTVDHNAVWKVGQLLQTLGQSHAHIDGLDADFLKEIADSLAYNAMISVWKEDLNRYWSPEVEDAWKKMFKFIFTQVYLGMKSAPVQNRCNNHKHQRKSVVIVNNNNNNNGGDGCLKQASGAGKTTSSSSFLGRLVAALRLKNN